MGEAQAFQLSPGQLAEVRDRLTEQIRRGLAAEGQTVAALPAYFAPPPADLSGDALVVDTGGTNMRAAWVRLGPDGARELVAGPVAERLEVRDTPNMSRADFFRMQAQLVEALRPPTGLPVGYCFSYPSEVTPERDARLIKWTKGIELPDVVDTYVGTGLHHALGGLAPRHVRVLNDTVAALLATSLAAPDSGGCGIGLIVGTGTNMACYATAADAPKLAARGLDGTMAINLESGNYHPPHLHAADDAVDADSPTPGQQRFEKAISGYYLPFIFRAAAPHRTDLEPHQGTGALVDLVAAEPGSDDGRLARAILDRSADLVAAGLAAVIATYDDDATILAEGSLFWRAPGYRPRVESTLQDLLPGGRGFTVTRMDDANLFGAAAAALVP